MHLDGHGNLVGGTLPPLPDVDLKLAGAPLQGTHLTSSLLKVGIGSSAPFGEPYTLENLIRT